MANSAQAAAGSVLWLLLMMFVLAVLKLTGSIAVSWWWVFSPLWIVWGAIMVVCVVMLLAAYVVAGVCGR